MSVETYLRGQLVTARATFRDTDGVLVDPGTVTFKAQPPHDEVETRSDSDPEVQHPSEGVYSTDWDFNDEGTWHLRVESTGSGQAAGETTIRVVSAFD